MIVGSFDCYRTISGNKELIFKLLENLKVFEIRDVFVACGQLFPLCPAERPVMKHYALVWSPLGFISDFCMGVYLGEAYSKGLKECFWQLVIFYLKLFYQ